MLRYLYVILFARYIVYVQSMCVPICISIGTKFTNLENMQKSYVLFYVTLRKKPVRRSSCRLGIILIGIFIINSLQTTRSLYDFWFKQYGSNSGAQTVVLMF